MCYAVIWRCKLLRNTNYKTKKLLNKMKKHTLLLTIFSVMLLISCGKQCEKCDCWKGGKIIDNYKHCSSSLLSSKSDHKFYRDYMIRTYDLDSVTCK